MVLSLSLYPGGEDDTVKGREEEDNRDVGERRDGDRDRTSLSFSSEVRTDLFEVLVNFDSQLCSVLV